jgi:hypothetical protein
LFLGEFQVRRDQARIASLKAEAPLTAFRLRWPTAGE